MAGESAQEKADAFAARRRKDRGERGYLRLLLVAAGLGLMAAVAMHVALGAWWLGALPAVLIVGAQLGPSPRELAWRRGAEGERIVGAALDRLAGNGVHTLHDRRMPRSRANIDHILVGPAGVVTVDAKRYRGKLESRHGRELWVAGRDRSKLLAQARSQADAVRSALSSHGIATPVRPALCFTGVEWPLFFPPREIGGVQLVSPRSVHRLLTGPPTLPKATVETIVTILDGSLPPAAGAGRTSSAPVPPQPRDLAGSSQRPGPPPDQRRGLGPAAGPEHVGFTFSRWKRYGHDRLYANLADGRTAGYIDVPTGRLVIELEEYAAAVTPRLVAARVELQS